MKRFVLGAAIGDMAGSTWEGKIAKPKYGYPLFPGWSTYTDDTVMTAAIAAWSKGEYDSPEKAMRSFGKRHPGRGYGGMFGKWIHDPSIGPYGSWGNGSAMRVSFVPYSAKTWEECESMAKRSAECTHGHPDAVKGAVEVARAIWMSLRGATMTEIRRKAEEAYPEIARMSVAGLVRCYSFSVKCSETVPQALACFLESESFEDCLRKTLSIGGDSDTLCAISCSIAEAFYGVPEKFAKIAESKLSKDVLEALSLASEGE